MNAAPELSRAARTAPLWSRLLGLGQRCRRVPRTHVSVEHLLASHRLARLSFPACKRHEPRESQDHENIGGVAQQHPRADTLSTSPRRGGHRHDPVGRAPALRAAAALGGSSSVGGRLGGAHDWIAGSIMGHGLDGGARPLVTHPSIRPSDTDRPAPGCPHTAPAPRGRQGRSGTAVARPRQECTMPQARSRSSPARAAGAMRPWLRHR
jgi:hypothetical protein